MLDYIGGAMAHAERERWPRLGLSTTRRALTQLGLRYNDSNMQCLSCFICGQLRTTCEGYASVNLDSQNLTESSSNAEIRYRSVQSFCNVENKHPGTLLNNCSYDLWCRRYNSVSKKAVQKKNNVRHRGH